MLINQLSAKFFSDEENAAIWNLHHLRFEMGHLGLTDFEGHRIYLDCGTKQYVFETETWNPDMEEYELDRARFNSKEELLKHILTVEL